MNFKILTVLATGTDRNKLSLGDQIEADVRAFLEKEDGVLDRLEINSEYSHSTFGKAIVTVYYSTGEKKPTKK